MKKQILSALLAVAMSLTLMPTMSTPVNAGTTGAKSITTGTSGIIVDNHIYYGNYDYISTSTGKEPIKWRVLSLDGNKGTYDVTGAKPIFLLSENALTNIGDLHYSSTLDNDWLQSYARNTWCANFTVADRAFSSKELAVILATTKKQQLYLENNTLFGKNWETGTLSSDKVFFLSVEEVRDYISSTAGEDLKAYSNDKYVQWWLRSYVPEGDTQAGYVGSDGTMCQGLVGDIERRARPAFNLNANDVLFSSAADGGKSANGMDSGLTAVSATTPTEWKLTLLDSERSEFSVTDTSAITAKPNETKTIAYTGAKTGTNEYVSAMICSGENILYYGRLASSSESGTANFTIPSDLAVGSYTLKIFNEQYNGDKKTDYSSAFKEIVLTVSNSSAAVGNVTVSGMQGEDITATDVTLTLTNDTFKNAITADTDVSGWFKNLPAGLVAKTEVAANGTTATITISGKPTAISTAAMAITIPAAALTGNATITTTANANAKWSIAAPTQVTFSGLIANGEANTTETTELTITLDKDVTLTTDDITVTGATKGTLTGSGTSYTLTISNITVAEGEDVTVTIAKSGYVFTNASKSVAIHKAPVLIDFIDSDDYNIPSGTVGTTYTSTAALTATGGTGTLTFTVEPLVAGLSIAENKLVYSRPAVQAVTTATMKVTDSATPTPITATITIDIGEVTAVPVAPPAETTASVATNPATEATTPAETSATTAAETTTAATTTATTTSKSAEAAPEVIPEEAFVPEEKVEEVISTIEKTEEGAEVKLEMDGKTAIKKEVLEAVAGKDVDLVVDMGGGVSWVINGKDIENPADINLEVSLETNNIPENVISEFTDSTENVQLSLTHSGALGFKAKLTVDLEKFKDGKFANLFYFNEETGKLEYQGSSQIANGKATFDFNHASEYLVMMSDKAYEEPQKQDNPATGVALGGAAVLLFSDAVVVLARKRK